MAQAPFDAAAARRIIHAHDGRDGAMLPILHDLQARFGYIDDAVIPLLADALNISKAETVGVVSFYHDFRRAPVPGAVMKLCRAESCQAAGCESLVEHLERRHGLHVDAHDSGPLTVETVYCLGFCALSPAALVDGEPVAKLTEAKLDALVAKAGGRPQ